MTEYCKNPFELHDRHGFPLVLTLGVCIDLGISQGETLRKFVTSAKEHGWSMDTITRTVRDAVLENNHGNVWRVFE